MISTTGSRKSTKGSANGTTSISYPYNTVDGLDLNVNFYSSAAADPVALVNGVGYTITLESDPDDGCTIHLTTPLYLTQYITISRSTDKTQTLDLRNQTNYFLATLEDTLDKLTRIAQENADSLARTPRYALDNSPFSLPNLSKVTPPATATDTGSQGMICFDANYIYICTASNTWKRVALSSF